MAVKTKIDPRAYIEFLLKKLRLERYFYLLATVISLGLLLYCLILKMQLKDWKSVLVLFGPTGAITFTGNRILKIWNDCFKLIAEYLK